MLPDPKADLSPSTGAGVWSIGSGHRTYRLQGQFTLTLTYLGPEVGLSQDHLLQGATQRKVKYTCLELNLSPLLKYLDNLGRA
jgi:hypothetical protein